MVKGPPRFDAIDASSDPSWHVHYLDTARRHPSIQAVKERAFELMALAPGDRVIDIGCGTGEDLVDFSMPGGLGASFGVDNSIVMGREAMQRTANATPRSAITVADVVALPFDEGAFTVCRSERTLQHVSSPGLAVAEIARILRPGGRAVISEPDWATLSINTRRADLTTRIYAWRLADRPGAYVGRELRGLLAAAGLDVVTFEARTSAYLTLADASDALQFESVSAAATTAGALSAVEAADWHDSLAEADAAHAFVTAVTLFTALAVKPAGVVQ